MLLNAIVKGKRNKWKRSPRELKIAYMLDVVSNERFMPSVILGLPLPFRLIRWSMFGFLNCFERSRINGKKA
jgi:hypothetical protein